MKCKKTKGFTEILKLDLTIKKKALKLWWIKYDFPVTYWKCIKVVQEGAWQNQEPSKATLFFYIWHYTTILLLKWNKKLAVRNSIHGRQGGANIWLCSHTSHDKDRENPSIQVVVTAVNAASIDRHILSFSSRMFFMISSTIHVLGLKS